MSALVGKYFTGVHDHSMRSGIVEAAIDMGYYIVRFDDLIGFNDGTKWPEALAVVAVVDMLGGAEDEPPPWWFFDNLDQRATHEAWYNQPLLDRTPSVVPLRRPPKS
jgi:hypothetical protein